jgi:hypothetical protein
MSIDPYHLRSCVIGPVLAHLDLPTPGAAEELLMMTAAQETHMGRWLRQNYGKGSANGVGRGIYSIEPSTHKALRIYFAQNTKLMGRVDDFKAPHADLKGQLVWNLAYSTAIARLKYYSITMPLPKADDLQGLAEYWDKYFNGNPDHGFPEDAIMNYERFVRNG